MSAATEGAVPVGPAALRLQELEDAVKVDWKVRGHGFGCEQVGNSVNKSAQSVITK
jgi:hypothetical protein